MRKSYYAGGLAAGDQKLLGQAPVKAELSQEVAVARLWLRRLLEGVDLSGGPGVARGDVGQASWLVARLLVTITRMTEVQKRLGDSGSDGLDELNELIAERMRKAGLEVPSGSAGECSGRESGEG